MKKLRLFALLGALAAISATAVIPTEARTARHTAHHHVTWNKWDVAPYAGSLDEECRKNSQAIDGTNMPAAVKEHFKHIVGPTCSSGTIIWLTPEMALQQMWSGGNHPHVMTGVTVGDLKVLQSPDGRNYRDGAVAEAARAMAWSYEYDGKVYTWFIPFVCFNAGWMFSPPTMPECAEVHARLPKGLANQLIHQRSVRYTTIRRAPVTDFNCWGIIAGQYREGSPHNCDWCVWTKDGLMEMQRRYGHRQDGALEFAFYNTSKYDVPEDVTVNADGTLDVTIVLPVAATKEGVAVCVEVDGVIYQAYLILPESWGARASYQIPIGWYEAHPPLVMPPSP